MIESRPVSSIPRSRSRLVALAVAVVVVGLALSACSADENGMFSMVNSSRAQAGTGQLNPDIALIVKAQAWSKQLAADQSLYHSNLSDGAPAGWYRLGENVGTGSSLAAVNQAFLDSAPHRANILEPSDTHLGVGVTVDGNGRYWIVEEFAGL